MNLSIYGLEYKNGNPVDFQTLNLSEAKDYARRSRLRLVEHVYEWTEKIPVEGCDFTGALRPPNIENVRRDLPTVGMRVQFGVMEGFPDFYIDRGETGTVALIAPEHGGIAVKLDSQREKLNDWGNLFNISTDHLGDEYPEITDKTERLAIAFWLQVEKVLSEPQTTV